MKIGRIETSTHQRLKYDDGSFQDDFGFFGYVSWCYPSESIYIGPYEIIIQNRRKQIKENTK